MRIIAGQFKGTKLFTPKNNLIRPTSDRTREFLFSYIGPRIIDAHVLDLFAGTGAFGLEALSRGCREAVFVDSSFSAITLLRRNLEKLGLEAEHHKMRAQQYLKKAFEKERIFDIIFCDPPYTFGEMDRIVQMILDARLLKPDTGLLIYEAGRHSPPLSVKQLALIKEKKLGDTLIFVYEQHG